MIVKRTSKKRRALGVALAMILLAGLGLVGCGIVRQRAQAAGALNKEDTTTAFIGDLSASASASGQLLPQRQAELALTRPGRVEHVYIDLGDVVDQGQVLLELETGDLERAQQSAEQSLRIQEANLASLSRTADPEDVAAARAAVESAQAQLDDVLAGPTDEELAQAQASLETAQARLDALVAGPTADEMAQARTALDSAKAALLAAKGRYDALDDQLVVAQSDIDNAERAIGRARDAYDQLIWNSKDPMVADSWGPYSPQAAAVRRAEVNRDVAVANKTLTEINVNDAAVRAAEAQVAQAEAALAALTDEQTAQIAAYRAQVSQAEASLAALTDPNDASIAAARAQLAQAQANLARLLDGPSDAQLATAQAQVEQARIGLEEATDNLEAARLVAPFAGTVTALYTAEGEVASGPVVELVDTASLRIVLDVDEVDIGSIRVGEPSAISLETWPDHSLSGQVVAIAPNAGSRNGIVTYEVQLSFDADGLPVRTGMTANADLTTAQHTGVLLVPNRAITVDRQAGRYYVNKVVDGKLVETEVTIGLRDDAFTEVTSGLSAGDQVYTGTIEAALDFRSEPPSGMQELRSQ
jgi:HlyD family secretion protein